MRRFRRWLKKWNWTKIWVWLIVILACIAFWVWVIDSAINFFSN